MKYPFYESIQDTAGNVLDGAYVYIYLTGTTTAAKIYDYDGHMKDTAPQLQTDSKGYFWFEIDSVDYGAGQLFDIRVVKTGYEELIIYKISIINSISSLVPYTGAEKDVDLGLHTLVAQNILGTNTGDQDLSGYVQKTDTVNVLSDINSPGADIEDAVAKRHAQNTDTDLDPTFEATFVKKVDTVNVLSDITSAGADIEDAVTKKHTQNTDTQLQSGDVAVDAAGIVSMSKQSGSRATKGDQQAIANQTFTLVHYYQVWDIQNEYDGTTNFRFTAKEAGIYAVKASLLSGQYSFPVGGTWQLNLYKNGGAFAFGFREDFDGEQNRFCSSVLATDVNLAANDYIDIRIYQHQGGTIYNFGDANHNYFSVAKIA